MIRKSAKTVKTTMTTNNDRFVTPTLTFDKTYPSETVSLWTPTLDDDSVVTLEVAPREHRFNYPCLEGKAKPEGAHGYADNGIILEFDMDDADGTTITDRVQGLVLTEQGDPTFQQSPGAIANAGLGNGVALDGTGDGFDFTLSTAAIAAGYDLPDTGSFSIEVVFATVNGTTAAGDTVICCRDGAAGIGWSMVFDDADHIDFHIDDTTEVVLTGDTDVDTGSIVHCVATLNRPGNGLLYVNGAVDDTTAISTATGSLINPSADTRFAIGYNAARAGDAPITVYFARVYNKVLTAAEVLENYRIMMNKGYPGWVPKADPADGDALVVCKSASDPIEFDFTEYMVLKKLAMRAKCTTEQTTSATDLDFYWLFE